MSSAARRQFFTDLGEAADGHIRQLEAIAEGTMPEPKRDVHSLAFRAGALWALAWIMSHGEAAAALTERGKPEAEDG